MRMVKLLVLGAMAFMLAGCAATGARYGDVAASFPAVAKDKGRVFFYRSNTMLGAAITADIHMNGKVVGRSQRGGFFYVDTNPGNQTVLTSTEVERKLTFTLARGETKYVRTGVSVGILAGRINPTLVGAGEAKTELADLSHNTGLNPQ
jgi:hypothetical protein